MFIGIYGILGRRNFNFTGKLKHHTHTKKRTHQVCVHSIYNWVCVTNQLLRKIRANYFQSSHLWNLLYIFQYHSFGKYSSAVYSQEDTSIPCVGNMSLTKKESVPTLVDSVLKWETDNKQMVRNTIKKNETEYRAKRMTWGKWELRRRYFK